MRGATQLPGIDIDGTKYENRTDSHFRIAIRKTKSVEEFHLRPATCLRMPLWFVRLSSGWREALSEMTFHALGKLFRIDASSSSPGLGWCEARGSRECVKDQPQT